VYIHLQLDSEIESAQKLEDAYFGAELCSTVLKTDVEESDTEAS
jgi:hypothetical protein